MDPHVFETLIPESTYFADPDSRYRMFLVKKIYIVHVEV
jgi:hypothetical protein